MASSVTFTGACLGDIDFIKFAAVLDDGDDDDYHARIFTYHAQRPEKWFYYDVERRIKKIALYLIPPDLDYYGFCSLSDEGEVEFYTETGPIYEKIEGSGLYSDDACGWGYMTAIKQINDHLYACGGAGQVYRREGPNHWVHMDEGILQARDVSERILPRAIDGSHESSIYLVGSISAKGHPPFAFYWNGQSWRKLDLPEVAERINNLYIESEDRVWMCGANGTLLLGNANDGFESLSTINDNQLFYSISKYQEKMYLGSNLGLFVYDPNNHAAGIQKVVTGLNPELQDANVVDSLDHVLWSIGPKDIARFDGIRWERIHHPDNPPIGGSNGNDS